MQHQSLTCSKPGRWRTTIQYLPNSVLDNSTQPLSPQQIRVQVLAAGIDFPQILTVEGKHVRSLPSQLPCVLGRECAGIVIEVGKQVETCKINDYVFGDALTGSWGTVTIMNEQDAFTFNPTKISPVVMSGVALNYGTSYHALIHQGELKRSDVVLVLGAGGGVGTAAVDIAKSVGCFVIACASSEEKLQECKRLGADRLINYSGEITNFRQNVEKQSPGGIDVCYDPIGGPLSELAIRMLKFGGRHIVVGFASAGDTPKNGIPKIPLNLTLLNERKIVGVLFGGWKAKFPQEARVMMNTIARMCESGQLKPNVSKTFPLKDWTKAVEMLMGRDVVGKIVFVLDDNDNNNSRL
jgi:NADPH2:quinone reductase